MKLNIKYASSVVEVINQANKTQEKLFYSHIFVYDKTNDRYGIQKCFTLTWNIKRFVRYIGGLFSKKIEGLNFNKQEQEKEKEQEEEEEEKEEEKKRMRKRRKGGGEKKEEERRRRGKKENRRRRKV